MSKLLLQSKSDVPKCIDVVLAVIHYHDQYLLGFRDATQHQGDLYEFIGGKIESDETAQVSLIREVNEEVGIDIGQNEIIELGLITHDYSDKQVRLHTYKVELTSAQYDHHKYQQKGLEGQSLSWVTKSQLMTADYPLPAANQKILTWL